ncbi:MAG TPA: oligosaccharide flippase family protein [Fibrobacteria bacterium]|nr:oligosaccharide flippase family protein [Fibrobacteria bacterium]
MILAINLVVGVILARELDPATFGLYGIATFCLSLITMAMDFGIGGSLIQRKGNFGDHELSVVFTLQTGISIVAAILVWFLAPLSLTVYKHASPDLVWIIRSLALPILFSPIGTVARLQLERSIQFHKVATIDIAALILSNVTILALVFTGHGVWSFVGGNIANALATTAASWFTVRYRPRLVIDRKLSRELFSFGMFFQFGNIANEAAGWIIPLIAGAGLGPAAVGLLTWSSSNARRPLMVVDNVMRVAFPHFSRLQTDPAALAVQVDHYFRRLLYLCYAWCFLAFVLGAPVTKLVYTEKWLPGVLPLQLFALGLAFDVANWVGGMTLTAIGGVKETAIFTLVKSLMAITGASVCVWWIGIIGIPIASMAASFVSGVFILIWLRKRVPYHFSQILLPAAPYLLGGLVFLPFAIAGGIPRLAAGWILGAAAIGWTGRVFYLEFVKNRPRDGLANQN